jgi:hypothetical protein
LVGPDVAGMQHVVGSPGPLTRTPPRRCCWRIPYLCWTVWKALTSLTNPMGFLLP